MSIWEEIHSSREWGKYPNEELVRFIGRTFSHVPKDERGNVKVLEIGFGQGANVWFLIREGFDVYGIDISKSAREKMKSYLEENKLLPDNFESRFRIEDMKIFKFEERFGVIIDCASVLCVSYKEHFDVFKNIFDHLSNGGYFWSFHILKSSWGYGAGSLIDRDTFDNVSEGPLANQGIIYFADLCDLTKMLEDVGFKIENKELLIRTYENVSRQLTFAIITAKKV